MADINKTYTPDAIALDYSIHKDGVWRAHVIVPFNGGTKKKQVTVLVTDLTVANRTKVLDGLQALTDAAVAQINAGNIDKD